MFNNNTSVTAVVTL